MMDQATARRVAQERSKGGTIPLIATTRSQLRGQWEVPDEPWVVVLASDPMHIVYEDDPDPRQEDAPAV